MSRVRDNLYPLQRSDVRRLTLAYGTDSILGSAESKRGDRGGQAARELWEVTVSKSNVSNRSSVFFKVLRSLFRVLFEDLICGEPHLNILI